MKTISFAVCLSAVALLLFGCAHNAEERQLQTFITAHVAKVETLSDKANLAYWDASTTGESEYYDKLSRLQIRIRRIQSDPQEYTFLRDLRESGKVGDARLARQLDKLCHGYLQNQIEPGLLERIVDADTKIQEKYNNFRGTIEGEKVTNSDVYTILTTAKDIRKRELAWKASKQV